MSEDRKKHIRTQGRYSDSGRTSFEKKQKISPSVKEPSENRVPKRYSNESRRPNHSSSEEVVPSVKYEGNSDYSFKELDTPKKPIEISEQAKITLSSTENGESLIFYEPHFMLKAEAWDFFDCLKDATNWYSKNIVIHGEEYPQPRLVAWYGPYPYTYSGATLEPAEMPDTVLQIKHSVEKCLEKNGMKAKFNSVLLNLYRNGKDSVAWHSDDESTMGIFPTIASVSLGETRKFEMKRKKRYPEDESSQNEETYFVNLKHGSLIVMDGCMQEDWQHRVPKEYHDKGPRINLTFRTVFPIEKTPHYPLKELVKKSVDDSCSTKSTKSSETINFDDENFPPLSSDVSLVNSAAENSYFKRKEHANKAPESEDSKILFDDRRNVEVDGNNDGDAFDTAHTTNPVKFTERNVRGHDSSVQKNPWVSVKSPVNISEDEHLDHKQHPRKGFNERHEKRRGGEKPHHKSFNEKPDKIWTDEEKHVRNTTYKKEVSERIPKRWNNQEDSRKQWRNRQASTKKYLNEERQSENWDTEKPSEKWEDEESSVSERPVKKLINPMAPPKNSFNENPDKKWSNEERWVRDKPHKEVSEKPPQKWINEEDSGQQRRNRQTYRKSYFDEERQSGNWDTGKHLKKWEDEETSGKWSHEDHAESWAYEKIPGKKFYKKADEKCTNEEKCDEFPRQIVSEKSSDKSIDYKDSVKQCSDKEIPPKNCFNEERPSEKGANEEPSEKWVDEETSDNLEEPSSRLVNEDTPQQWVGEEMTPGEWSNKETAKNWWNVEAKEFVPNNSFSCGLFQPNQISLEELLHYETDLMDTKILQDHALQLKNKVEERVRNFHIHDRDRDELEFLCTLTDGSQSDKNQKLIIKRMCNILNDKLQTLSNDEKSYSRSPPSRYYNPRKYINGNQNYADNGRRYYHSRGNGHNYRL